MPTYEYRCNECKLEFEEFQSITADALEVCPDCSGKVERLISSGNGLIFKGSGFYITDYKNSNQASERSESEDSKKSESKKETKPTKKMETKPGAESAESK